MPRKITSINPEQQRFSVWLNYWLEVYAKPNVTISTYLYQLQLLTHVNKPFETHLNSTNFKLVNKRSIFKSHRPAIKTDLYFIV